MSGDLDLIATGLRDLREIRIEDQNIIVLNLHGNYLTSTRGLPVLQNLTELNLSSNRLITCELPELAFLPSLMALDISGNNIDSLYYMPFLPGLRILSISFNRIRSLVGLSENTPDLVDLDLRGNLIDSISSMNDLVDLNNLQKIWLGGRQPNPLCKEGQESTKNIHELFRLCDSLRTIDGKVEMEWEKAIEAVEGDKERKEKESEQIIIPREKDDIQELNTSTVSQTPRFDELAKRFKSHSSIMRLSRNENLLSASSGGDIYKSDDIYLESAIEGEKGEDAGNLEHGGVSAVQEGTEDVVVTELRDSAQYLPISDEVPTQSMLPAPLTHTQGEAGACKRDTQPSSNPWCEDDAFEGVLAGAVGAVAASMAAQSDKEKSVEGSVQEVFEEASEARNEVLTSDVAVNTSVRLSTASQSSSEDLEQRVANNANAAEIPAPDASGAVPSAPEAQNKNLELLLEQHTLLEQSYAAAEALRVRLGEVEKLHKEELISLRLALRQTEASRDQEKYKTEAALRRVFTAEASMMDLRKESEERLQALRNYEIENESLRTRLAAVDEEKEKRKLTMEELGSLFERQKRVASTLKADNEMLNRRMEIDRRDMKSKFAGELHRTEEHWKKRVEQYQSQLSSVEREDQARETAWENQRAEYVADLSRVEAECRHLEKQLDDERGTHSKLERRFVQLQNAFEEATDQLHSLKEEKVVVDRRYGENERTDFLTDALKMGSEASKETIEELCACVKSLRVALSTAEGEREKEHKAASRLYTQMTHARDEIHRLRRLAGVKDEAGSTFRRGGMRLVLESLNSVDESISQDDTLGGVKNTGEDSMHSRGEHEGHEREHSTTFATLEGGQAMSVDGEITVRDEEDDSMIDRTIRESLDQNQEEQQEEEQEEDEEEDEEWRQERYLKLVAENEALAGRVGRLEAALNEKDNVADKAQELVQLMTKKEDDLRVTLRVKDAMLVDQGSSIATLKDRLAESEARAANAECTIREMGAQLERYREQQEQHESEIRRQEQVGDRMKAMIASYRDEVKTLRMSAEEPGKEFGDEGNEGFQGMLSDSMESLSRSGAWSSSSTSSGKDDLDGP